MSARPALAAATATAAAMTLLAAPANAQEPFVGTSEASASALELEIILPLPAELGGPQPVQVTIAGTEAAASDGASAAAATPLSVTAPVVGTVALGGGSAGTGTTEAGAVAAPGVPGVVEAEVLAHQAGASPAGSAADAWVLHVRVIPLGDLEVWVLRSSATAGASPSAHTDAVAIRIADRFLHLLHSSSDGTTVVSTILLNEELAPLADGLDRAAGELCPIDQIPGVRVGCAEVTGTEATVLTAVLSELAGGEVPGLDLSAVLDAFRAEGSGGSTSSAPTAPPSTETGADPARVEAGDDARSAAVAGAALARTGVSLAPAAVGLLALAGGAGFLALRDRVRSRRADDPPLPLV